MLACVAACGSDGPSTGVVPDVSDVLDDTGVEDTTTPEPDVPAEDAEPEVIEPDVPSLDVSDTDASETDVTEPDTPEPPVYTPTPTELRVRVTPGRATYPLGLQVTPVATVYSELGREIPDLDIHWSVEPSGAASPAEEGRWRLDEEGFVTFTGCVGEGDAAVCGSRGIQVNDSGATVVILEPAAGAELRSDEHPTVTVVGQATDTRVTPRVYWAGQPIDVDDDGIFTFEMDPVYGINHVDVVATDGLQSIESRAGLDYMWAVEYLGDPTPFDDEEEEDEDEEADEEKSGDDPSDEDAPGDDGEDDDELPPLIDVVSISLEGGAYLRLGQRFIDGGSPLVWTAEGGPEIHDLAHIFQVVIQSLDIMEILDNPVVDSEAIVLFVTDADLGEPIVELTLTNGGLDLYVGIPDLHIETEGLVDFAGVEIDLDGTLGVSVSIVGFIQIDKAERDAPFVVEVDEITLAIEDVRPDFASDEANAVFALAEGALFGVLEDLLVDALAGDLLDQIPDLVVELLGALDGLFGDEPIEIDLGLGLPVSLSLDGEIGRVRVERRRYIEVVLDMDISTASEPSFPDSRGAAMSAPQGTEPPFFAEGRVQAALPLTLVNGLFHALWNSGLLEIDASDLLPPAFSAIIQSAHVSAKLPPVLTIGQVALTTRPFMITLGQLEIDLTRGAQTDTVGANIVIGASVVIDDGAIRIELDDVPVIRLWPIEVGGERAIFENLSDLEALLADVIFPELTGGLIDGLALELPELSLAGLSDLSPALDGLVLLLQVDRDPAIRDGFIIIDGTLAPTIGEDTDPCEADETCDEEEEEEEEEEEG